jgi:hypothetical protein
MKYFLLATANQKYGLPFIEVEIGVLKKGILACSAKDAKILKKAHGDLVQEISEETYEDFKKKVSVVTSTTQLRTVYQDPLKDPNAVYAKKEEVVQTSPSVSASDLVTVGEVVVDNPLSDID